MSYWGKVKPGTPAVSELAELIITKASVGPMDNNAYLLRCRRTDEQVLIDAANEADTLLQLVGDGGLARVITTHQHWDHWQALGRRRRRHRRRDRRWASTTPRASRCRPSRPVDDGDTIPVGVMHSCRSSTSSGTHPARSPCCTTTPRARRTSSPATACSPAGSGKTQSPADFTSLLNDVESKVFDRLSDETWVYPGHGKDTTLGAERPHLGEWRARGW